MDKCNPKDQPVGRVPCGSPSVVRVVEGLLAYLNNKVISKLVDGIIVVTEVRLALIAFSNCCFTAFIFVS